MKANFIGVFNDTVITTQKKKLKKNQPHTKRNRKIINKRKSVRNKEMASAVVVFVFLYLRILNRSKRKHTHTHTRRFYSVPFISLAGFFLLLLFRIDFSSIQSQFPFNIVHFIFWLLFFQSVCVSFFSIKRLASAKERPAVVSQRFVCTKQIRSLRVCLIQCYEANKPTGAFDILHIIVWNW